MDRKKKIKATQVKKYPPKNKKSKKLKEIKKRTEYVYSKLEDMMTLKDGRLYLYAVLLDCSSYYFSKEADKYLCVGKLIDSTVHDGAKHEYLSVTFFARNKDELPMPSKVGSIIRIHRGETHDHKKKLQLNVDVDIKAAWILFDPTEGNMPIAHTGKNYSWVEKDNDRLKEIRHFAKEYFAKNEVASISLKEATKKQPKDFDPILLVLDVKKKDNKTIYKLCDDEMSVKLVVEKGDFDYVGPQDVVRIRSTNIDPKDIKYISINEYSRILKIPKEYKSVKVLHDTLKAKKVPEYIKNLIEVYTPLVDKENVITTIKDKKRVKGVALKDLSREAAKRENKLFNILANVIEVGPKNPHEWIWVHDTKTKENLKPQEVFEKCKVASLPAGKEYYYKMQLYLKDKSVMNDTNMYIVFLCTIDGKGSDFIDVGLKKDKVTEEHYKTLKNVYKKMTRPWNSLDLIVEAVEVAGGQIVYFIVDTVLQI